MILHKDEVNFRESVLRTSAYFKIAPDIVVKDYFVTLFLKTLKTNLPNFILKAEHLYPSVTKQSIDFQKILIFHTIQSMMEKSHKVQSKKQTEKSDKQLKILDLNI